MAIVFDTEPKAGTPELSVSEIEKRVDEILGDTSRFGVFPVDEETLKVVRQIARNRKPSSGAVGPSSVELIREARAGAMWSDVG